MQLITDGTKSTLKVKEKTKRFDCKFTIRKLIKKNILGVFFHIDNHSGIKLMNFISENIFLKKKSTEEHELPTKLLNNLKNVFQMKNENTYTPFRNGGGQLSFFRCSSKKFTKLSNYYFQISSLETTAFSPNFCENFNNYAKTSFFFQKIIQ